MTVPDAAWIAPRYGTASLADLLPSALAALAPGTRGPDALGLGASLDGIRKIAVLLVDGLGRRLLAAAGREHATLADIAAGRLGQSITLTSGFPSTTPTSLVGLGTGAPPGAHGVVGFTVRVPGTRRVLNHIRWTDEPSPATWQPVPTVFTRAAQAGVAAVVVAKPEYAGSGLSVSAYRGAEYRGANDAGELAAVMRASLAGDGPALVYGYHADLDNAGHIFGLDSDAWRAAAAEVGRLVHRLAEDLPGDSALLVTADHGQIDVPAENRFDIDGDPALRNGLELVAGEARVRYLYARRGATDDVVAAWREVLGGAADVMVRDEAIASGWFGAVAPPHADRIGEIVVACRDRYAVVRTRAEPREATLVAYHGSSTAAEMEIPLAILRGGAVTRRR